MKYMDIKLPKSTKDLRIKHFKAINRPLEIRDYDIPMIAEFISDFTGMAVKDVLRVDLSGISKIYKHILELYSGIEYSSKPKKRLTVNGKKYELINFWKCPTDWHIDNSAQDYNGKPVMLAAMCYIPEGSTYGAVDKHGNFLHPIKERIADFEEHFELQDYINLSAFFLKRLKESTERLKAKQTGQRMAERVINQLRINGKKAYI